MGLIITCPAATALTTITPVTCFEDFGQVQRVFPQRIKNGSTKNSFTISSANPNLLASWTALKTATDSTKVVFSPIVAEPTHDGGDPRTYGSGNATPNGIPIILGANPTSFSLKLLRTPQKTASEMKLLMGESELGVYLVNEHGQIGGIVDSLSSPTKFFPIPIQSFFVGDKIIGGYEGVDYNPVQFNFKPGAMDKFYVVAPSDFDALVDL